MNYCSLIDLFTMLWALENFTEDNHNILRIFHERKFDRFAPKQSLSVRNLIVCSCQKTDKMSSEATKPCPNENLLQKYDIPIQHLDFVYVEKCSDATELEKILKILRSGEEGFYPELITATENRLSVLHPKSKLLRKTNPILDAHDLPADEQSVIETDLKDWFKTARLANNELESRKTNNVNIPAAIRKTEQIQERYKEGNKKRISSTDYESWDKYDPDKELLKDELAEEASRATATKKSVQEENEVMARRQKKCVSFNKHCTEAEAIFLAEREREKGNEFFKVADYQQAIECYTNSIETKATTSNLNNRAISYILLKQYNLAINDCEFVLKMDSNNFKAYHRMAEAFFELEQFDKAQNSIEIAIKLDPNSVKAQQLAERIRNRNTTNNCCLIRNRLKISE